MNHRVLIPVLAAVLAFSASVSLACLNDTAVRAGEDEFRSRYEIAASKDAPAPSNLSGAGVVNPWGVAGLAAGSGLIAGCCIIGFRQRKRRLV